jgi:predicted MFS family arabinose efflux permease
VYTLVDANSAGWGSAQTLGLGALSLALIAAFYVIERRSKAPLMPFPGIFRIRTITGINVSAVLIAAALFSMFFFISLYMQQVLGFSALDAGLAYLPLAVGIIITAGASAGLVTRFGFKPVLVTGLLVTAAGLLWFTQVDAGGSYLSDLLGPMLLAAIGLGLAFVSMTVAAVSGVEAHEAGLASGLINTSQQIGGALGLAVLTAVATGRTENVTGEVGPAVALNEGFQAALLVAAGIVVAAVVLTAVFARGSRPNPTDGRRTAEETAAEPEAARA